ncbi:MAG: protein phosphatase 2C domain-containing protein [Propionicimonas sp.]
MSTPRSSSPPLRASNNVAGSDLQLIWGARTDVGLRRRTNEDALIAEYPVFLVADGMGGHEAGGQASERALAAFRPLVGHGAVTIEQLNQAFREAAREVGAIEARRAAAGTTISGAAVSEHDGQTYWLVVNLGDSRTYRLSAGELEQISVDHSAVQELIDEGKLAPSDAEGHPERHVITKAIGAGSRAEPDYWLIPANDGDRLLVCSDGLSKELGAAEIAQVLLQERSPDAAASRLVHQALLRGGRDNVTVIVVDAHGGLDDDYPTAPAIGEDELEVDTVPRIEAQGGSDDGQV